MRRGTWIVIGAVLLVGFAAAADSLRDALRGEAPAASRTEAPRTTRAPPVNGFGGVLYYTSEGCRLSAVQLPDAAPAEAPQWDECGFSLSPDARRVAAEGLAWHPGGTVTASASAGRIRVAFGGADLSERSYVFRGSAPAFDGRALLTFALGGEIRAMDAGCPLSRAHGPLVETRAIRRCSRVLVTQGAIVRAARRHPNGDVVRGLLRVSVPEAVWVGSQDGPERLAALVRLHVRTVGAFDVLALFERGRLVELVSVLQGFSGLRASSGGTYFGVLSGAPPGALFFDHEGRSLAPLPLTGVRAFDWSPDERWLAVATPYDVYVSRAEAARPDEQRFRRLAIVAHDLAWRDVVVSAPAAPPIGGRERVRELLDDAGAAGILYFADRSCRLRTLVLPEVAWRATPARRAPCRFSLSPAGEPLREAAVPQPGGRLVAVCRNDAVGVFGRDRLLYRVSGACAPAWRPGGALTYVRRGALRLRSGAREERVVLSRRELERALGPGARLEEVAWFDDREYAAAVRRGGELVLAVFRGAELVQTPSFSSPRIEGLRATRGAVAARTGGRRPAVTFFARSGRELVTVEGGHAVSWSPGGGVAAVAGRAEVVFVAPGTARIERLALFASDLEWRTG